MKLYNHRDCPRFRKLEEDDMNANMQEIINIATTLPLQEKIILFNSIEKDVFEYKFNQLLEELNNPNISQESLLEEIESVRESRYKNSH